MLEARSRVGADPAGLASVWLERAGVASHARNGQLRTGADKGNPTV